MQIGFYSSRPLNMSNLRFDLDRDRDQLRSLLRRLRVREVIALPGAPHRLVALFPAHVAVAPSPAAPPGRASASGTALSPTGDHPRIVVAVMGGDDLMAVHAAVKRVALYVEQNQLPVQLWLEHPPWDHGSLAGFSCVDPGPWPRALGVACNAAAGGVTVWWNPARQPVENAQSAKDLVDGWR